MIEPVMSREPERLTATSSESARRLTATSSQTVGRLTATSSQTIGPFFHFGLAQDAMLGAMAGPDVPGERIRLHVAVIDGDGLPVPDALIELWQADASGEYSTPIAAQPEANPPASVFSGFGRQPTSGDGTCVFETIRPGLVPDLVNEEGGRFQASHINVCLFARGLLRQLYTRVYFAGDDRLQDDVVLAEIPEERRRTLLATPVAGAAGDWRFEIRLQGAGETVFFDL
jgi:protocatechuate 3,4-dioxygenase alpha subunit